MSKKKGQTPTSAPRQSKVFTLLLYPEWASFNQIITYIQKEKYALMLHDKDVADEETGELKKPHVHVVIKYQGRRTITSVQNEFKKIGVESRLVDTCNEYVMLRYLCHVDDKDKYQYPFSNIDTNDIKWVEKAYKEQMTAPEQLNKLLDFIDVENEKTYISRTRLARFAINNNCYSALRSNMTLLNGILSDHNAQFRMIDENAAIKAHLHGTQRELAEAQHNVDVLAEDNMRLRGIEIDNDEDIWK